MREPRIGFILSLPRSGSTYVQRVLSGSPDVATVPEPWLLPALFGIRSGDSPLAEFGYDHMRAGLSDLLGRSAIGNVLWDRALAGMAREVYGFFTETGQIFIDKTPRNAAFAPDIMRAFPQAPILIVWRNPLAIVASINRTWGRGRWKACFYHYDLYLGLQTLLRTARAHAADPRVRCVRYEDLITRPEAHWPAIFSHFGALHTPASVAAPPPLPGVMGDARQPISISQTAGRDWETAFGNPLRRGWARRYLDRIGPDDLTFMGYDRNALMDALRRDGDSHWTDIARIGLAPLYHWLEPYALRTRRGRTGETRFARR